MVYPNSLHLSPWWIDSPCLTIRVKSCLVTIKVPSFPTTLVLNKKLLIIKVVSKEANCSLRKANWCKRMRKSRSGRIYMSGGIGLKAVSLFGFAGLLPLFGFTATMISNQASFCSGYSTVLCLRTKEYSRSGWCTSTCPLYRWSFSGTTRSTSTACWSGGMTIPTKWLICIPTASSSSRFRL